MLVLWCLVPVSGIWCLVPIVFGQVFSVYFVQSQEYVTQLVQACCDTVFENSHQRKQFGTVMCEWEEGW